MAFDECIPYPEYQNTKQSTNMTHRWLDRCIEEMKQEFKYNYHQTLFPIVQGGVYKDLRDHQLNILPKIYLGMQLVVFQLESQ